mgnify:CR=1 FL=1
MKTTYKTVAALIAVAAIFCGTLAAAKQKKAAAPAASGKLKIVTTIFPEYDWVREILGDKAKDADITLLLDNGVDLHSYQPTAKDIMKIANADLFIYVGGESDEWVEDALKEAVNKNLKALNLLELLGDNVKEEEVVEGMEAEEEEDDDDGEEKPEYDEHVWLSLRNAQLLCIRIAEALCDKISKSAVYRNLSDLEQEGQVRRSARGGEREIRYQFMAAERCRGCLHLCCTQCGRTFHMDSAGAAVAELLKRCGEIKSDMNVNVTNARRRIEGDLESVTDVAEELELHESTISRAVKNKYIQCARGMFPMSAAFL